MRVSTYVQECTEDEGGAVTVDWVVLAATVVVLGTGIISALSPSLTSTTSSIEGEISSAMSATKPSQ